MTVIPGLLLALALAFAGQYLSEVIGIDPEEGIVLTNDIFEERDGELVFSGYLPSFLGELVDKNHLDARILFAPETVEETS